jgi:hypothetical protein
MYKIQTFTHLLKASTVIEKHNATRNTAFTNAPKTSARAQPKVFFDHFFGDIYKDKTEYTHMHPNRHAHTCAYTHIITEYILYIYLHLHKIIPLTLIDKKATTNAATSLSM